MPVHGADLGYPEIHPPHHHLSVSGLGLRPGREGLLRYTLSLCQIHPVTLPGSARIKTLAVPAEVKHSKRFCTPYRTFKASHSSPTLTPEHECKRKALLVHTHDNFFSAAIKMAL